MSEEPKDRHGTVGIQLGPGARNISFGTVAIEGAEHGIIDHSTGAKFDEVTLTDVGVGISAHGIDMRIEKLLVQPGLAKAVRAVSPEAVAAELRKEMTEDEVKTALEVFTDIRGKGEKVLEGIEGNPIYRTARIAGVAASLIAVIMRLTGHI